LDFFRNLLSSAVRWGNVDFNTLQCLVAPCLQAGILVILILPHPFEQTTEPPMQSIQIKTTRRTQLLDITSDVQRFLYVPHTTAGILINEHADPDVASDAEGALDRLIPASGPYRHAEGNSDSHVKTILTNVTQFVFVYETKLALGRWQGIFLAEFDGPRTRKVHVKVLPDRV
jgi:secondary thiamine-phosphate synthase enzyme